MADDCRKCSDFFARIGQDAEWTKSMSLEELNKVRAKIRVFKCPDCGNEVNLIHIVKPK
jgi:uncharacterized protein (UPF0212 family)